MIFSSLQNTNEKKYLQNHHKSSLYLQNSDYHLVPFKCINILITKW